MPNAAPTKDKLPTVNDAGLHLAVIEAPADSRSKFKYQPDFDAFVLHTILPAGTSFPYAFGFVPSTLGEDGDALDIVVLADEPPPVGAVVPCRIVAILLAKQKQDGETIRNDRLLGIAHASERFADCRSKHDVSATLLDRISEFFAFYHSEQGKTFEPLGWKGRKAALAAIDAGRKLHAKRNG